VLVSGAATVQLAACFEGSPQARFSPIGVGIFLACSFWLG